MSVFFCIEIHICSSPPVLKDCTLCSAVAMPRGPRCGQYQSSTHRSLSLDTSQGSGQLPSSGLFHNSIASWCTVHSAPPRNGHWPEKRNKFPRVDLQREKGEGTGLIRKPHLQNSALKLECYCKSSRHMFQQLGFQNTDASFRFNP